MDVCKDHGAIIEKQLEMSADVKVLTIALVGEDLRGGLVKDIAGLREGLIKDLAEVRSDIREMKLLEEQKKKERSQIIKGVSALGAAVATVLTALSAFLRGS